MQLCPALCSPSVLRGAAQAAGRDQALPVPCQAHRRPPDSEGLFCFQLTLTIVRQTGGLGISIAGGKGSTPYKGDDEVRSCGRLGDPLPASPPFLQEAFVVLRVLCHPVDLTAHFVLGTCSSSGLPAPPRCLAVTAGPGPSQAA